jgi:hypothetical protein
MIPRCSSVSPGPRSSWGVIAITRSRVEAVEEVRERLRSALEHIAAHRLIAPPDCGIGPLGRRKLEVMTEAAHPVIEGKTGRLGRARRGASTQRAKRSTRARCPQRSY